MTTLDSPVGRDRATQLQRKKIELIRSKLSAWGRAHKREFPWRSDPDPFHVLIAELLLQRSRASTVAKVYPTLFERWPDAQALAGADTRSIGRVIRPLGLVARAVTIKRLANRAAKEGLPQTVDGLMEFPGVGRYVATATAVVAFGEKAGVVDGVTARVYRRVFGLNSDASPAHDKELWAKVQEVTPSRGLKEWNWAVLDLANAVCLPKLARCEACPLNDDCDFARGRRVPVTLDP